MQANEQLSLFDAGQLPDAAPALTPAAATPGNHCYNSQTTSLPRGGPLPGAVPIHRPATLPAGCRWMEVETPAQSIGFMLRTSRRKTIGLTVNDDGLVVTVPRWVSRAQVAEVVRAKAPWVLRKLQVVHERQKHLATADAIWQDGGRFPYLGVYVQLSIRPDARQASFSGDAWHPSPDDVLTIALQADSSHDRVRERVHAWLQQQARDLFDDRLRHYCALAGVTLKGWRLASPAGRWGSCSSDGRIMLNWRLIHFERDVLDYVVAHEVAHLRHMNHGPEFWREVGRLYPDFSRARLALKPHHPGSLPLL